MSLFPTDVLRRVLDPKTGQSTETSPVPLEQSPELAPDGKGFLVVAHPYDQADPERFLGSLPDGLSAQALDLNRNNPTLMDYAVSKPEATQITVERFGFGPRENPRAKDDARIREESLRKAGYKGVSMLDYGGKYIVLAAKKADPNPAPKPTKALEIGF